MADDIRVQHQVRGVDERYAPGSACWDMVADGVVGPLPGDPTQPVLEQDWTSDLSYICFFKSYSYTLD